MESSGGQEKEEELMTVITSPLPYPERLLLYGDGGSGKTTALGSIAAATGAKFHVIENDYSAAWDRVLYEQYPEIDEGQVEVHAVDDWEELIGKLEELVDEADVEAGDWIVMDSASPVSYEMVQEWVLEQVYGDSLANVLLQARKNYKGTGDQFKVAKMELMQWDLVKKEYVRFWRAIKKWKGHMALTAEAKQIGFWDKDDADAQRTYGRIGYYPAGQDKIRHAMATTLYLAHPKGDRWTMTTVKDRGREEMDKAELEDFAEDYLVGVAGWRKKKAGKGQ